MRDSAYRVETTSRLAQWRIDTFPSFTFGESLPFTIANWNWRLSVEKSRTLSIRLYSEVSKVTRENPPIASFIIKVMWPSGDPKCLLHPEVRDKVFKSNDDFVWAIDVPITGNFIIDLEFFDIKPASPDSSIWKGRQSALSLLSRMLSESIHTDILLNASNGSLSAHGAVVASRSTVLHSILNRKGMCSIDVSEMSVEACKALLNYMYGNIRKEEFLSHRLSLLDAADKYDISDLKEAIEESLVEDMDTTNVLGRLQSATLYQLPKLKSSCMLYLVKFGRILDIGDDLKVFLKCADRQVVAEIFNHVLGAWKGF